jgi:hypothetical protein
MGGFMVHSRTLLLTVKKLLPAVLVVLLVTGVFVGCDNLFGSNSSKGDDTGHLGMEFTLPGGAISGEGTLPGGTLTVHAYFVHAGGENFADVFSDSIGAATVEDDTMSTLEIQGTPETAPWDWLTADVMTPGEAELARLHIILHNDNPTGNPYDAGSGRIHRATADDSIRVDYWYVDRDVVLDGTLVDEEDDNDTLVFNEISLKTGWNRIVTTWEGGDDGFASYSAGAEPDGAVWIYAEP